MEGEGLFRHANGHELKGRFANNLFNFKNSNYLNPMKTKEFNEAYLLNADEFRRREELKEKTHYERVRFYRVKNHADLENAINDSVAESRTPLCLTAIESEIDSTAFQLALYELFGHVSRISEINMRL